jgi:hypothetical protein
MRVTNAKRQIPLMMFRAYSSPSTAYKRRSLIPTPRLRHQVEEHLSPNPQHHT